MPRADRRARKKANTAAAREEQYADWRRYRRRRWAARILVVILVVALAAGGAVALLGGDDDEAADTTTTTGPQTTTTLSAELAAVECTEDEPEDPGEKPQYDAPPEMQVDTAKRYRATITTSCGDIVVELDPSQAPETVNNFVFLAREGFYDGVTFHRVVSDFVIQSGDPTASGGGGPGYQFEDELPSEGYAVGDMAMANSGPNTNGSQWFIVTGQQGTTLPQSYSKFGKVVEGLAVAQRLEKFETPGTQAPSRPIYVFGVTITEV